MSNQATWKITYDNDTGPDDEGFWEWWNVTDGKRSFKCDTEADAKFLRDALLALVQPAVSEEMEPFGWYYEHKNGDCDPELVFERWSDPGRSNYVETQLFARAQSSSKGDEE